MRVSARLRISLLVLSILFTLAGTAAAQNVAPATVTYKGLVELLRSGESEEEILDILAKSQVDVGFVLGDRQLAELKKMRVSDEFLDALRKHLEKPVRDAAVGDVTDFAVILDCSGSMKDLIGNSSKMDVAKAAVKKLIDAIPNGRNLTFVIYGYDAKLQCKAVKVVRALDVLNAADKEELTSLVDSLAPAGHTPIAGALRAAGKELGRNQDALHGLILFTDGMETCHRADGTLEDPAKEAATLAKTLNLKHGVTVIGLGLKPEELAGVKNIADSGHGKTFDAQDADEVAHALTKVTEEQLATVPVQEEGELINLAAAANGGVLVDAPAQYNDSDYAAANLIDSPGTGQFSAPGNGPISVVVGFRDGMAAAISAVAVNPASQEDVRTWVNQVEVEVSATYPFTGFKKIGTFEVPAVADDAVLELEQPVVGRYVRFTFLANGGGGYMEAGEVMVFGTPLESADAAPPAMTNVALAANGGRIAQITSEYSDDFLGANLIDGNPGRSWSGKSGDSQMAVIDLGQVSRVSYVTINPYCKEATNYWAAEAEVFVSKTPNVGFKSIGKITLAPIGQDQALALKTPTAARYVKVVFLKNGGGGYMEAHEVKVFAEAESPR